MHSPDSPSTAGDSHPVDPSDDHSSQAAGGDGTESNSPQSNSPQSSSSAHSAAVAAALAHCADQYRATSQAVASQVIGEYSSSFGLASRLLSPRIRKDIHSLYAMVRVADEIVDGAAAGSGLTSAQIRELLDDYEKRVYAAIDLGFSTDLVIHGFATMARECKLDRSHIAAFFASMRSDISDVSDISVSPNDTTDQDAYIYGSAEVIGLMCFVIFTKGMTLPDDDREQMEMGARRLGAAFQKINFLRDYATDTETLQRSYLTDGTHEMSASEKSSIIADIRSDLAVAEHAIAMLPSGARIGVRAAFDLFEALTDELDRASVEKINQERVRISAVHKATITGKSVIESAARRNC